jgi:hypothetical protein
MISKHQFGMDGERYQKSQVPQSMFAASNQWHAKRTAQPETNATPENATSRCIISNRNPLGFGPGSGSRVHRLIIT